MRDALDFLEASLERLATPTTPLIVKLTKLLRVNLAHSVYMQDGRHLDATQLYEQLVAEEVSRGFILSCEPIVLANLCVVYILAKQNQKAEQII